MACDRKTGMDLDSSSANPMECELKHIFDVPEFIGGFSVYQCVHCKKISVGRWSIIDEIDKKFEEDIAREKYNELVS